MDVSRDCDDMAPALSRRLPNAVHMHDALTRRFGRFITRSGAMFWNPRRSVLTELRRLLTLTPAQFLPNGVWRIG